MGEKKKTMTANTVVCLTPYKTTNVGLVQGDEGDKFDSNSGNFQRMAIFREEEGRLLTRFFSFIHNVFIWSAP